jgi:DNA-binding NtrC family response regulator
MAAINSGPLLHVADLPSSLQNFLAQKKSQYLMAAASAQSAFPAVDPQRGKDAAEGAGHVPNAPSGGFAGSLPTVIPLMELERRAIMNALEYTKGDRAVAAHLLGIGRTTLYRKLKEYQLAG